MSKKQRNSPIDGVTEEAEEKPEGSGDLQGLSKEPEADSESVEELADEGQALEAGIIDAVENAPDADVAEVKTKEVPEDDVPQEYLDEQ